MDKTVIGVGQVGSRLAKLYSNRGDVLFTFNTDPRDTAGTKLGNDKLITTGGAGQNYDKGLRIWAKSRDYLEKELEPVYDKDVIYFVAAGGGSGSSSVVTFLNILLEQKNRILLVMATPFLKESIPATSNATRLLSRVAEFSNSMSVLVVSNDEIGKSIESNSFIDINDEIVKRVRLITDLASYHDVNSFTPFAIDEGDHRSVAYSGGFINLSLTNLEEGYEEKKGIMPKFSYGNVKEATNILITKCIHSKLSEKEAMESGDRLLTTSMKVSNTAKSARTIHGTIRINEKSMPEYITIATGMDIDKTFSKLKEKAIDSALLHTDKLKEKQKSKLDKSEDKILNI